MVNGKILPDIAWKRLKEIKPDIDESNREKITRCSGVANKLNTALDTVESILQGECTELLEFVTGLENLIEATICEIRQRFNSVSQSCIQDLGITSAVKDINDPIFGKARVCMLTRLGMIENGKIVSSVAYNRLNEIRPIDKSKREKLNKSAETANASSNIEEIATSFVRNGGEEIQIIDKLLQNREKDIPELKC